MKDYAFGGFADAKVGEKDESAKNGLMGRLLATI
jgi:hypothetical protein